MNEREYENELCTLISGELGIESSSLDRLSGPGKDISEWDSFAHILLLLKIEEVFSIKFTSGELSECTSLGSILSLLQAKART